MNCGIRSEISMPDRSFTSKWTDQPIGLMALIQELDLPVRRPTVRSWIRSGARKTIITSEAIKEYYPQLALHHDNSLVVGLYATSFMPQPQPRIPATIAGSLVNWSRILPFSFC